MTAFVPHEFVEALRDADRELHERTRMLLAEALHTSAEKARVRGRSSRQWLASTRRSFLGRWTQRQFDLPAHVAALVWTGFFDDEDDDF